MNKTLIEWAKKTWNPVTGCTKISPGCAHCYAERMAGRLKAMGVKGYENGFDVTFHPGRLKEPLKLKKPSTIFVCSMGDLFHEAVEDEWIKQVWDVMWRCKPHTFLTLTKRKRMVDWVCKHAYRGQFNWGQNPINEEPFEPGTAMHMKDIRMRDNCGWVGDDDKRDWCCDHPDNDECGLDGSCSENSCPLAHQIDTREGMEAIGLGDEHEYCKDGYTTRYTEWMTFHARPRNAFAKNVWLGVTIEDQERMDERAAWLRKLRGAVPHATLFVSIEPMLSAVDISPLLEMVSFSPLAGSGIPPEKRVVDGVILGGESGPGARPMNPDWPQQVHDDCAAAGVPFMFKQWGAWTPNCLCHRPKPCRTVPRPEPGSQGRMFRCGKKSPEARLLDGRTHDAMPGAER